MAISNTINYETCKICGLCGEVCPSRIIKKDDSNKMIFRADRLELCFQCGQCMAICPTKSIGIDGLSYTDDFADLPPVTPDKDAFLNAIMTSRAIRNFDDRPVPKELLQKIVDAIAFAPPGFPPIKTELTIVQNTTVIRQALPQMIAMYDFLVKAMNKPLLRFFIKRRIGKEKYNLLATHVIPIMKKRLPDLKAGTEDTITRNAPAMIVFHADKKSENYRGDIMIALTHGFLAAHALGLGACVIDLVPPAIERSKELRKLFIIPDSSEVVASMIVGFPKYKYQRIIKRKLKSITWI